MGGNSFIPEFFILGGGVGDLIGTFIPSFCLINAQYILLNELDSLALGELDDCILREIDLKLPSSPVE